jgi:hypothetical protein
MSKLFFLIGIYLLTAINCKAQAPEDSVKIVISQMFAAMKNGDAVTLKTLFADSALLQSIARSPEGKVIVRNESIPDFIELVGKQPSGAADERIQFETIKVAGPLATVWTPYSFYFNGQFSHCGVNSFQLVRINNAWKIQYIIDTRRKEGCE